MAERKLPVVIVALSDGTPRAVYKRGRLPKTLDAFCEYVEYVPRDTIEPKRPLQWRPLPELTGESRYILVANTEHVASRIHYNSRASISVEQLCLQQEGYEPTHFCELPELDSNETEPARPLQKASPLGNKLGIEPDTVR